MLFTILLIVSSKKINIAKNVNCEKKIILTKNLWITKEDNQDFGTLLNVGFVILIILMKMMKSEIIKTGLGNIEALHMEIVISILLLFLLNLLLNFMN